MTRNGASSDDVSVYSIHVSQLLLCESEEDYHLTYETLSCMWSKSWKFYFDKHLASDIATKAGKWLLDSDAIYGEDSIICPFSGITTNVSESFNKVLKDLNKWREVPVDLMVLTLYSYERYLEFEFQRSFSEIGQYKLKDRFAHFSVDR